MRVLVCGGRHYADTDMVREVLSFLELRPGVDVIVHGDATGTDALAKRWAWAVEVKEEAHPADWRKHGRAAGPIRNEEMLKTGIDLVVAFPGGRGTEDMVRRARRVNVVVLRVEP